MLLGDIAGGSVDVVIVWHPDRLHRSPVELEYYIAVCDPLGVDTHSVVAGQLDLSTASGRMTARIIGVVALHESELKGERISRQKRQSQAGGRWVGGQRPFGFERDGETPRPVEAEAIRRATADILTGMSIVSTPRRLNESGSLTSGGLPWNATACG